MFERNGNNCLGSLPFLLLGLRAFESDIAITLWLDLGRGLVVAFALTLCLTNQIHAWAHSESAPPPVRVLQRMRVLLAPERHSAHHRGQRNYAVVSGWSNRALDMLLPPTERVLAACGLRPSDSGATP